MKNFFWISGGVLFVLLPASVSGLQSAVSYRDPDAVSSEQFSLIKGVRELSDGRLIVSDYMEERVAVLDLERGGITAIGRVGGGPAEYRLPSELVAMSGDSTLLIDYGNQRLAVIGPDLKFARTLSMNAHGQSWGMRPKKVLGDGSMVFSLPVWMGPPPPRDSVEIGRWKQGSPVAIIGDFLIRAYTSKPSGRSNGLPYVAFAKQDGWSVDDLGWVGVARSQPYRVDWYGPAGEVRIGPEVAYEPISVTMDDRRAHVRGFLMSTATTGRGEGDGAGVYSQVSAAMRSDPQINRAARTALFEEEFPPFIPGSVRIDQRGLLWVQRSLPVGSDPTFNVFDRNGVLREIVTLGPGRRIVGFGAGTLYATAADEFDLLTLERYRIRN
jgi:hypothetical protein